MEGNIKCITLGGGYHGLTFYVIRVRHDGSGVMAYLRYVLFKCMIAEQRGYIPVVDMRNAINPYLYESEVGVKNAWEYFFEQPAGYSLDDISNAENIVFSSLKEIEPEDKYCMEIKAAAAKYIRFAPNVMSRVDNLTEDWASASILGVKLRGTDYVTTRAKAHAVQPDIEEAIAFIMETIKSKGIVYDALFLATEDATIIEAMRSRFGGKLILNDIDRFDHDEVWFKSDRLNKDKHKMGEDYCVEIGMLIRCNSLIASGSQGTWATVILNNDKFETVNLIRLGAYK